MAENKTRSPRASERQKEEILKYFEDNPRALRILNGSDNRAKQKIWIQLTHKVNTLDGALKTTSKWAKYWNDILLYTKTRAKTFVSGEVRCDRPPNDIEKRTLVLIGHMSLLKKWQETWESGAEKNQDELSDHNVIEASCAESGDVESERSSVDDLVNNEYETMVIVTDEPNEHDVEGTPTHNPDLSGRLNSAQDSKQNILSGKYDSCDFNEKLSRVTGSADSKDDSFVDALVENVRTIGNNFNSIGLALHNIASVLERYSNNFK